MSSSENEALRLGHPVSSCHTLHLLDLKVQVYGYEEIKSSKRPIAAVIATHGRTGKKEHMADMVHGILGDLRSRSEDGAKRDALVVTLDQRNHGERTHDRQANLTYDQNPRHLYDMAACVVGGCQDVSYVIDFLAAYLFPRGERIIDEWIATGVSLGGNVTYRLLLVEPRIRIAIPIIGLPWTAFHKYLKARAHNNGLAWAPPLYPPSIRPILEAPLPPHAYDGKKILSLHGGSDPVVPIKQGQEDIDSIFNAAPQGEVEVFVQEGKQHEVTPEMVQKTADWIWKWALQDDAKSAL